MSNAQPIVGVLNALNSTHIRVHQNRCAKVRNRNASCLRCAEACTSGCISFVAGELTIRADACIGCGTCATVCPTCALEAVHPSDSQLFSECAQALGRSADGSVELRCRNCPLDDEKASGMPAVYVTCLGRVEESLLLMLATLGASRITLVGNGCAACVHHTGRQVARDVLDTTNALLEAWGYAVALALVDRSDAPDASAAPRPAFAEQAQAQPLEEGEGEARLEATRRYAFEKPQQVASPNAPNYVRVMADKTLPHFLPGRRKRILEALAALGPAPDALVDVRLWGHASIDFEKCGSCCMCATFCPTGAIQKFAEPDGTFGIRHYPSSCVKCRCCESICHNGALTLGDAVRVKDVLTNAYEQYSMKPLEFEPGDLTCMHERIAKLSGVEECYDH